MHQERIKDLSRIKAKPSLGLTADLIILLGNLGPSTQNSKPGGKSKAVDGTGKVRHCRGSLMAVVLGLKSKET